MLLRSASPVSKKNFLVSRAAFPLSLSIGSFCAVFLRASMCSVV
jgi:hypothetical protein